MSIHNLDKLFRPSAIAVIGASERPGRIGTALMDNLVRGEFKGRLYPVNPGYRQIMGLPATAAVRDIGAPIDLALIAVPINQVPEIIGQCVASKVPAAIIISAGGKETGAAGQAIEARIAQAAAGKIRILGPNCLGIMVPGFRLNASFAAGMPNVGNLAFASQSGGVCAAILDVSFKEGLGFSHFISVGSMLDVDFGDVLDYLGRDPAAKSILLYIEQLSNIRRFMSAARAVSRIKPIIVLKAGSSPAGAQAAASHTGALAGEDAVYDTAFKRAGVIRVRSIEELFDCAELMAKQPRPAGRRMAVITNGGGPGVMAIDAMARYGLEPATLSTATIEALNGVLPPYWSHQNPVDILGDADAERYAKAVTILSKEGGLHGLMLILAPQALIDPLHVAQALAPLLKGLSYPVVAVWMGGRDIAPAVQFLNDAGIATYTTPERAVQALTYMAQHTRNLAMAMEIPPRLQRRLDFDRQRVQDIIDRTDLSDGRFLTETLTKEILQAYRIPVTATERADTAQAAAAAAAKIGWPVALKILSPDISHKTDADGVQLDLRSTAEVLTAYERIMAGAKRYNDKAMIEGVSVQPYLAHPDYELLMGIKRDQAFGPVIVFGLGGIFTEVLRERALGLPPLNRLLIRRLMEETRVFRLLQGYRNRPAADMAALEDMLLQLSQLAIDFPEIAELDINPVIVKDSRPIAVDARILLRPAPKPSPLHLIISPYPAQYELCTTARDGRHLLIRPIQPEDAGLFVELFKTLSPTSVYYRFFRHMKELSAEMLAMLTQIDYDRHMALVALDVSSTPEKMLGVARIITDPTGEHAEFSIMVGDPWQGQGVGAQLLLNLLKAAKQQGMERIWGTVLPENTHMQRLGKKCGFTIKYNNEEGAFDLTIDLKEAELED
ncbi:MAG: GNAT family N-acetyltransferase [Desulforhopalus sp.]|nr:GNAT family N-acetyltransferase [Desulforhopalus sp.]